MADRKSVHVTFFSKTFDDGKATLKEGRQMFKDVDMVEIRFPGDNKRVHVAPAREKAMMEPGSARRLDYIERFPDHWKRYQDDQPQGQIGTPLAELPFLTEAKRKELRAVSIQTCEALAELPDREIGKMGPGFRAVVNQAKNWLDAAAGSVETNKLAAENAELRERLDRLEAKLAPTAEGEDFKVWQSQDIKAFLKDATGEKPKGNPKHETLVKLAEEAVAAKQEAA